MDVDAWWVIQGSELLGAMRRAHGGEDPDLLFLELYANAEVSDAR